MVTDDLFIDSLRQRRVLPTKKQSCGKETRKSSVIGIQVGFSTICRNVEFQREIEQLTQRTAELTLSLDECVLLPPCSLFVN